MTNQMIINTRGDPLGTVRTLIQSIWQEANLEAMLVPINGTTNSHTGSTLIRNPDQLQQVNPFKPLMTANSARFVPGILRDQPDIRLGVLMRPCEMRALLALAKRDGFEMENLITICIDCLGTYPVAEFLWRAERKGSPEALTQETLQFARQGGIMAYRYRSACQLCSAPDARGADINIGVLGVPARQYILIYPRENASHERLEINRFAHNPADIDLLTQRAHMIARLAERRNRTHDRVVQGIADILPTDIESLVAQFDDCVPCQACLEACPICVIDFPSRGQDNRYQVEDIERWLASCSGCGMCEQACAQHQPLSAIFGHIHKTLVGEFDRAMNNSWSSLTPAL
ncbi:MAG TPA: hypothetical protein VLA49_16515 [Anaerolineales bacterium]|nr:hypothetical protein [Anaerolineales bacterium]